MATILYAEVDACSDSDALVDLARTYYGGFGMQVHKPTAAKLYERAQQMPGMCRQCSTLLKSWNMEVKALQSISSFQQCGMKKQPYALLAAALPC